MRDRAVMYKMLPFSYPVALKKVHTP